MADENKLATALGAASPYAALAGALLPLGVGISQLGKSRRMRDIRRPVMTTPQPLLDYLRGAQFRAGTYGLPGQGQMEAKLARQTAATQRAIQQSGQTSAEQMAALAAADQATKEQIASMGVEAARRKDVMEQQLGEAQKVMSEQKLREFQYNLAKPFEEQKFAAGALYQASMGNLSQFAENLSKLFASWGKTA
jgi:hypothetical protein